MRMLLRKRSLEISSLNRVIQRPRPIGSLRNRRSHNLGNNSLHMHDTPEMDSSIFVLRLSDEMTPKKGGGGVVEEGKGVHRFSNFYPS